MHIAIYLDPQKQSVIERFSLLGEFVMRGSTVLYSYAWLCTRTDVHMLVSIYQSAYLCMYCVYT